MSRRSKIDMPTSFSFRCSIPVRINDVNYGGHVGNDSILSILHEARLQYLRHLGFTELDFGGTGLIMTDVSIEFRMESFYGDVLNISIKAADFGRVGFNIYYRVTKKDSSGHEKAVAHAQTGMVCYNYTAKKLVEIPYNALSRMNDTFVP